MADRMITFQDGVRRIHAAVETSHRYWPAPFDDSPRVAVAAYAAVYTALCVGLLVGAMIAALILGLLLPGMAGPVAFFVVGLALVGAAPTAARRWVIAIADTHER